MADEPLDPAAAPPTDPPVNDPADPPAGDPPTDPPAASWGDDWRAAASGGDEKLTKALSRYNSPVEVAKALTAAQTKIRDGSFKAELPENATDEQVAEYRKATGVPETADKYAEMFKSGVVIGDDDKEMASTFFEAMHEIHAPPQFVEQAMTWYNNLQEQQITETKEADAKAASEGEEALRADWGADFLGKKNAIVAFLDGAGQTADGQSIRELLEGGRLANGEPIFSTPEVVKAFDKWANEVNPAGFLSPNNAGDVTSIDARIKEIEGLMRGDRSAYNKDEAVQAEYRKLIEARERHNTRAA